MDTSNIAYLKPRPMAPTHGPAAAYTEFTSETEHELVYQSVMNTEVWYALGRHVDGAALRDDEATILMQGARIVHGRGVPVSYQSVMQQLQLRVHKHEMTADELARVEVWFDDVEAKPRRDLAALVSDVAPVLRQRKRADILASGMQRNAAPDADASFAELGVELQRTDQIGELGQARESAKLDEGVWNLIEQLQHQDRLALGVPEIDEYMDGGAPRGGLITIGGEPGDGKSVFLSSVAVHNIVKGLRVMYFSLELGVPQTMLRILANVTGETIDSVSQCSPEARRKLADMAPHLGPLHVGYLSSGSTIEDLRDAIEEVIATDPRFADGYDLLVVDYADEMGSIKPSDTDPNRVAATVWRGLRQLSRDRQNWTITASQLKDKQRRNGTVQDFAESRHKGNVTDVGLLISRGEDDEEVRRIKIPKYRDGKSGETFGPMIPDFPRGRFHDHVADDLEMWADTVQALEDAGVPL